MNTRRKLYSYLVGCAIGLAPLLYYATLQTKHPVDIGETASSVLSFSMIVGTLVATVFAGGSIHAVNLWIICLVDAAFYSWLTYLVLGFWEKRRAKARRTPENQGPPLSN
jgi:hypothetical protein